MARINSAPTRLRLWLVRKLDPRPPRGEVWCMHCMLTGGGNLALDYSQMQPHIDSHRRAGKPGHQINLRGTGYPTSVKD